MKRQVAIGAIITVMSLGISMTALHAIERNFFYEPIRDEFSIREDLFVTGTTTFINFDNINFLNNDQLIAGDGNINLSFSQGSDVFSLVNETNNNFRLSESEVIVRGDIYSTLGILKFGGEKGIRYNGDANMFILNQAGNNLTQGLIANNVVVSDRIADRTQVGPNGLYIWGDVIIAGNVFQAQEAVFSRQDVVNQNYENQSQFNNHNSFASETHDHEEYSEIDHITITNGIAQHEETEYIPLAGGIAGKLRVNQTIEWTPGTLTQVVGEASSEGSSADDFFAQNFDCPLDDNGKLMYVYAIEFEEPGDDRGRFRLHCKSLSY